MNKPKVTETPIKDLLLIEDIPILEDLRGSFHSPFRVDFDERFSNMQFKQWNISKNFYGVTRGIHAEPWDKFIQPVYGKVFCAIVDLRREEPTFGSHQTFELDQTKALFVPKGCGNSFQVLTDLVLYGYLTTSLWFPDNPYPAISLFDESLAINWPIPKERWIVSDKDRNEKLFKEAYP